MSCCNTEQYGENVGIFSEGGNLPEYATEGSSGADLTAHFEKPELRTFIYPGETNLISTGIYVEIPEGLEIQIRPKSGLALKHGITVLNTPGTIDSDYRGEIGVILINHGKEPVEIKHGQKIAQMVLTPIFRVQWIVSLSKESLTDTERAEGGYGSTGK